MGCSIYKAVKVKAFFYLVPLFFLLCVGSCVEESQEGDARGSAVTVSRGIITASFNRYIETGSEEPFEQFGLTGVFARFDPDDPATVDLLWDSPPDDLAPALDSCTASTPVLDPGGYHPLSSQSAVELLDVGDLSVSFAGETKPVPTRTFPDLLKVIVGVTYAADETHGVVFKPGETYEVRAKSKVKRDRFTVALEAPEDLGTVTVDGAAAGEQPPVVSRERNVELAWEGDGYGDEVIATLAWTSMGSPWQIVCRMRDDGFFVIPGAITASLPDPLTATDSEMTLKRIRQVAFRSDKLKSSSFKFIVATSFSVSF
jgi:hypothetical protein